MIRRLMASTAMLALITAGAFTVAEAQTQPADAEQPAAVQQDAAGADQGAAPAGDAAATAEEPVPPPEGGDAASADQPADADATADAAAEQPADASTTADTTTEEPADASATADTATEEPASATADTAIEEPADATATADAAGEETLKPEEPTIASAFMGQSVFSSEDPESDNIGDVKDLIISDDGMITHAVVGVGGFLGIGEKEVAVPFDELQVVEDENGEIRLIYAATKEQLEAAEEFDRTAYDPERRAAEEQQAAAQSGAATDPAAGGLGAPAGGIAPAGDMAAAPEPMDEPAEGEAEEPTDLTAAEPIEAEPEAEADATTADAETDAAATDTEMTAETDAAAPAEEEATAEVGTDAAATDTEVTAETDAATAPEGEATAEAETDAAATEEQTTAQVETVPVEETEGAAAEGTEFDPESGFVSYNADQQLASTGVEGTATVEGEDISAENLIGTAIYSPEEETVGEVGDVILGQDGAIEAVVVDVGGFLGVGEKPVAIQFDALNVQKDTNGDLRLMVNATQEQLENAPSYEAEEATAQ